MGFAPEPLLDAATPPPTRSAPRAPVADDSGRSFGDHLDAVNETPAERPAPTQQGEAKDDAPVAEAAPRGDASDHDETLDPEVALLGGPLAPAPPPMAAPVIVQIAAAQIQQTPTPTQAQPQDAIAPVKAPEAPTPASPLTQDTAAAAPAEQSQDTSAENAAETPAAQRAQNNAQPQTPQTQIAPIATPQTPATPTLQVAVGDLPQALQQAIASTMAPAQQSTAQAAATPRVSKDAKQQIEAKAAVEGAANVEASANGAAKTPAAKIVTEGSVKLDPVALPTVQAGASDSTQLSPTNTISTTATHANTHLQHAAAETGAQRAAPAAAQVGREIVRRFSGGNTSFELRLDPADLGRVEVRMEVTRDHRVTAVITADNPQALAELARNARDLEQQLQSAGLQLSDNGLSFDLRQGAQGNADEGERSAHARGENNAASVTPEQQAAPLARPIGIDRWRGVRVDMMV